MAFNPNRDNGLTDDDVALVRDLFRFLGNERHAELRQRIAAAIDERIAAERALAGLRTPIDDSADPQRRNRCSSWFHWSGTAPKRAPKFATVGDSFRCELDAPHRGQRHRAKIRQADRPGDLAGGAGAALVTSRTWANGYVGEVTWETGE